MRGILVWLRERVFSKEKSKLASQRSRFREIASESAAGYGSSAGDLSETRHRGRLLGRKSYFLVSRPQG